MKIACKAAYVCIKSNVPKFKYHFKEADVPVEVEDEHTEKILLNSDFYKSDKKVSAVPEKPKKVGTLKKTWNEELQEIDGIGEKTARDIESVFPSKASLLETLEKCATLPDFKLPFDDDISEKLKEVFVH